MPAKPNLARAVAMLEQQAAHQALGAPPRRKAGKRARSPLPRDPKGATERQGAFLDAVANLTTVLGRPPNAVEIATRLGISYQGASKQLRNLESKGLVSDVPKVVSSGQWALTDKGQRSR